MIHSNAKKVKLPTKNLQETNEELHTHTHEAKGVHHHFSFSREILKEFFKPRQKNSEK